MSGLRVGFAKEMKVEFVVGDVLSNNDDELVLGLDWKEGVNNHKRFDNCFIVSFAQRKNKGVQPCGDDVPVKLFEGGCTPGFKSCIAKDAEWKNIGWYPTWTYDIDALIKLQNDCDSYAKAIKESYGEEKECIKPRIKVEYVKVNKNDDDGAYWECARDFAEKEVNYLVARTNPEACSAMSWMNIKDNDELLRQYKQGKIYRKTEREFTWRDELRDFITNKGMTIGTGQVRVGGVDLDDDSFIELCQSITSLTSKA